MVGIIRRREQIKEIPFDPYSIFDPITNTAIEADFIKLLEKGIYDSSLIGKKVTLSNTVDYNGGAWVIADVNHDSENTGQTNCYDLISEDCFYLTQFGSNRYWRDVMNKPRNYLNNTFYPGFSTEFKNHILNPKYNSQGTWYTDDKIIIPSYKEVNGGTNSYQDNEGIAYPIFTDNASRIKNQSGTSTARVWWTRSRYTRSGYSNYLWFITTDGLVTNTNTYVDTCYLASILRVS